LGKVNYKLYTAKNSLGVDFEDPASLDDIHVNTTLHLPVGVPVKMVIHSQDVIHDVGLPHFRLKMDAVPGIPTTQWFTPKLTTAQMREKTHNPDFNYEIACDQLCGASHYAMRGVIVVETMEEYKKWLAEQKSEYSTLFPAKSPEPAKADTVKNQISQVLPEKK
jgi:cytochrome c oxidase subunit 2